MRKEEHVDDSFSAFGTTFVFEMRPASVNFEIHEAVGSDLDGSNLCYEKFAWSDCGDTVVGVLEACPQVRGTVKWDGCSNVRFGNAEMPEKEPDGYLHLCGRASWKWLCWALEYAFERCMKLLEEQGHVADVS